LEWWGQRPPDLNLGQLGSASLRKRHQMVTGREGPHWFSIVARLQYHPKFGPIK
jgi:hypothetical protein